MLVLSLLFVSVFADCKIRGVDYSKLTRKSNDPYHISFPEFEAKFNVCGDVDGLGNAATGSSGAKVYSLGLVQKQEAITDNNGNGFKYTGGDTCKAGFKWSSTVYLECQDIPEDKYEVMNLVVDKCYVEFKIKGPGACASDEVPKEKLATMWIVFICIVCLLAIIFAVFGIWCLINFLVGRRGAAILPLYAIIHKPNELPVSGEGEKKNLI
ncbi:hypothetical protein EIN_344890 [Entamoeba invadens IP1]|uniref:MRH domain-containing protein n=1 Tax=Entamoeba invadens IP1 TaxID=370355 RepID=A0A0A1U3F0_ENTIV|nr:hypothetical protein EIN_344890 [Entamoeba invadens IP1]ELP88529.1 hypothetical protein EIN_344890 [Entamoeba invadens IP1]|eukprot:XP_004255300.1 hypothetical protein EIN_344890 [Entamoeba invadens IP1]